jgi:hypothetical protein
VKAYEHAWRSSLARGAGEEDSEELCTSLYTPLIRVAGDYNSDSCANSGRSSKSRTHPCWTFPAHPPGLDCHVRPARGVAGYRVAVTRCSNR